MKKTKLGKKIVSLILALTMAFSVCAVSANATVGSKFAAYNVAKQTVKAGEVLKLVTPKSIPLNTFHVPEQVAIINALTLRDTIGAGMDIASIATGRFIAWDGALARPVDAIHLFNHTIGGISNIVTDNVLLTWEGLDLVKHLTGATLAGINVARHAFEPLPHIIFVGKHLRHQTEFNALALLDFAEASVAATDLVRNTFGAKVATAQLLGDYAQTSIGALMIVGDEIALVNNVRQIATENVPALILTGLDRHVVRPAIALAAAPAAIHVINTPARVATAAALAAPVAATAVVAPLALGATAAALAAPVVTTAALALPVAGATALGVAALASNLLGKDSDSDKKTETAAPVATNPVASVVEKVTESVPTATNNAATDNVASTDGPIED